MNTSISGLSHYDSRILAVEVTGLCHQEVMRTSVYTLKVPFSSLSSTVQTIGRLGGKVAQITLLSGDSSVSTAPAVEKAEPSPVSTAPAVEKAEPSPMSTAPAVEKAEPSPVSTAPAVEKAEPVSPEPTEKKSEPTEDESQTPASPKSWFQWATGR